MTRPRRKAMPTKMSGRCMRCWRAAPACRQGNEEDDQMLSAAQRDAYERDGFIVVADVLSPAEIGELRRVSDEFVRNAAAVTANDEVYDLEDSHSAREPRVRRLKAPHLHPTASFRARRHGTVVAILK